MYKPVCVYCVITADLFHYGHIRFLKEALAYGDQLIVGVCSDQDVEQYKRKPILTLAERTETVAACKYVHQVIPSAPPDVNREWIINNNIDIVVAGDTYTDSQIEAYFKAPADLGILRLVPYTHEISTSEIISRCYTAVKLEDAISKQLKP